MAALAAVSASFAQSTVTLSGVLEIAPLRTAESKTQASPTAAEVTTKVTNTAQHMTWATPVLSIVAVEDLGGGLRATAVMISGVGDGFAARERTLALSSGMGTLRVGRFVPAAAAGFHSFSGTGSATLVGSSYALSTATAATNGLHTNTTTFERQDNVLQYTTPNFSGFTANAAIVNNKSDSDAAAATGKTANEQTSLHLGYAQGPLAFGLGMNRAKGNVEASAQVAAIALGTTGGPTLGTNAVPASSTNSSLNWVGASYNLGVASVFAHYVTRKGEATTAAGVTTTGTDIRATGLGVSAPFGATTLRASMYSGKDARTVLTTDDVKLSGYQISAVYALSKRTSAIAAMGVNEIKRDGGTAATRKFSATTLALNHSF